MNFPWVEFITILGAFSIGAISPGPDFAMVLRQSVSHGREAGIATSAGIGSAILVHGTYTVLGLGLIISQSELLFSVLKYAGTGYLLWLGIGALRSRAPRPPGALVKSPVGAMSPHKAFVIGFLTNLLNPKAALFFLALFTSVVSADTALKWQAIYILVMALVLFLWFSLVAAIFTTPRVRAGFYRIGQWFNRITGAALILLALKLALAQKN
ncbi:hypothetical protein MNBD_ALPHA12-962 [hydrothermal vent metagenome]|uniref:Threonine efflux protein n=1 Tax=hydrothermal vent metagenome TaxID=652676 RepID=A0A3B0U1B5_9ZZZZ